MKLLKTSRKFHKWFMAFLGIQFLIWSISGAYMVFLDIDFIHGDGLVKVSQDKLDSAQIDYALNDLLKAYPQASDIRLETFLGKPVYRFEQGKSKYLVDAHSAKLLSPLSKQLAEQAAKTYYSGGGEIVDSRLIIDKPPFELRAAALPAWRVNFDDFSAPTIYVSAQNGLLVGKRHAFWRLFDWMFRFHVMDYGDAEDVNNSLLFWFALLGIFSCVVGLILSYFRVFRAKQVAQAHANQFSNKRRANNGESL